MMKNNSLAYQIHVVQIHNAVKLVQRLFAHAYQTILAEHQIVDPNVHLAKNAQQIGLV